MVRQEIMKHDLSSLPPRAHLLFVWALFGLAMPGALRAQDCDANADLSVGTGVAGPGNEVRIELRGSSECLVTGFSLAIGYDNSKVEFVGATAGKFLVDHAGADLVFSAFKHHGEGFTAFFSAFDLSSPITVPPRDIPPDTLLATLTYKVLPGVPLGTTVVLRNEDRTFGSPVPIANVYTVPAGGDEIHPHLASGTIEVLSCDANSELAVGTGTGEPGGEVEIELRGGSACQVNGFSLAIGHDNAQVEFVRAVPGQFLTDHAGGDLVFSAFDHDAEGFTALFAAFDLSSPITVPPRDIPPGTLLATLTYRVLPGASAGTTVLRNEDRTFGSPNPISNVYTVSAGGDEIHPHLSSGSILIKVCNVRSDLTVGAGAAQPGEEVEIELRGSSECLVTGFRMAIGHDKTKVEFVGAAPGQFLIDHAGGDLVFQAVQHNADGYAVLSAAFDQSPPITVPPRDVPPNTLLATLTYRVLPDAPQVTVALRNEDLTFGGISNIFTVAAGQEEIHPKLASGSILIRWLTTVFLRGDARVDGIRNIVDIHFILVYFFRPGEAPLCQSAADANDDGRINILDAVFLVAFHFRVPGPAMPFPSQYCGLDPTNDLLTCDSYDACP